MQASLVIALFISAFVSVAVLLLGITGKAERDKARERRMAEHRLNARLLRLNI